MVIGLRTGRGKKKKKIKLFLLHRLPPDTHNAADNEVRIPHRDAPRPRSADAAPAKPPSAGTGSPTQRLKSTINTAPRPPPGEPTPPASADVRLQPKSHLPGSKSGMRAWYSAPTLIPTSARQRGEEKLRAGASPGAVPGSRRAAGGRAGGAPAAAVRNKAPPPPATPPPTAAAAAAD